MKSFSIDWYGGLLTSGTVRDTSKNTDEPVPILKATDADRAAAKPLEIDVTSMFNLTLPITIVAWEGAISSFGPIQNNLFPTSNVQFPKTPFYSAGMHVDTWLSIGQATGKMASEVFGLLKCGDSGCGLNSNTVLEIELNSKLYLNYWAHNMRMTPQDDWHCGYVIYYE